MWQGARTTARTSCYVGGQSGYMADQTDIEKDNNKIMENILDKLKFIFSFLLSVAEVQVFNHHTFLTLWPPPLSPILPYTKIIAYSKTSKVVIKVLAQNERKQTMLHMFRTFLSQGTFKLHICFKVTAFFQDWADLA